MISARSSAGSPGWSYRMFWKPVARWISAVPLAGKWWNASSGRVLAPCWTQPARPYSSRATVDRRRSVSKSMLDLGDAPVGQRHAAVAGAGLDADLAQAWASRCHAARRSSRPGRRAALPRSSSPSPPRRSRRRCRRPRHPAAARGPGRVSSTVLAAFTACCWATVGCDRSTSVLLSISMLRKPASMASRVRSLRPGHLGVGVRSPLGGVELEVVALQEDGSAPALAQGGGQDHRGVLGRPLVGVRHLRLRDLEHHRAGVTLQRRGEGLAGGQIGRCPDVDGRHGEPVRRINSPRPRARYSSWMLDEPQPSAWLADQISQRQASRSPSSALKTASNASASICSPRRRGLVLDLQSIPTRCEPIPLEPVSRRVGGLDGHAGHASGGPRPA